MTDGYLPTVETLPYYQARDLSVDSAEFFLGMVGNEFPREALKMPLVFVLEGKAYPVQVMVLENDRVELRSLSET